MSPKVGMLQWNAHGDIGYVTTLEAAKEAITQSLAFDITHFSCEIPWKIGRVTEVKRISKRTKHQRSDGSGTDKDVYEHRVLVWVSAVSSGYITVNCSTEDVPMGNAQGRAR
jgi:hypothetical protein